MSQPGRFAGKAALVTGATGGIGRACALALAREGARVVATGRRQARLEALARELGESSLTAAGDVRDEATCRAWVERAHDAMGGLDLLVNAAGVIGNGSVD